MLRLSRLHGCNLYNMIRIAEGDESPPLLEQDMDFSNP
jgi:hypothetical protein